MESVIREVHNAFGADLRIVTNLQLQKKEPARLLQRASESVRSRTVVADGLNGATFHGFHA